MLINANSAKQIRSMKDNSVDLILTDPPYNVISTGNMSFSWRSDVNNDIAEWDKTPFDPYEWVEEFKRVLKPTGNVFVFSAYHQIGDWRNALDPIFRSVNIVVWHKTNPTPNFRKVSFLSSCEFILTGWDKGHTWNFLGQNQMHNFIETPICMGNERLKNPKHPTQKPLSVLRHFITIASNPGGVVYDPFMGVGSTGVAAKMLGRKFIGVELDNNYYEASVRRIAEAQDDV